MSSRWQAAYNQDVYLDTWHLWRPVDGFTWAQSGRAWRFSQLERVAAHTQRRPRPWKTAR